MKKSILSLMFMLAACMGANAMSFERAQAEALYLTDKMAYELNLNDQQYNDAYEINLDYFLRIDSPSDVYGDYYSYRLGDFRCILHDWQYSLLLAADYFLRPIVWRAGGWYFPIYGYYSRDYYYYSRPRVWVSYYGGHGRNYYRSGFYVDRRPHWNGGLRGHDMHRPSVGRGSTHVGGRRISGNGYHIDMNSHRSGGMGRDQRDGGTNRRGDSYGSSNNGGREHRSSSYGETNHGSNGGRSGNYSREGSNAGGNHSGAGRIRGNSFDGSSSRMSGVSSQMSGGSRSGGSRGGNFSGSSRSSSYSGSSRSSSYSGGSRGGGFSGGSRSGGFGGGSRSHGGSTRGGRR